MRRGRTIGLVGCAAALLALTLAGLSLQQADKIGAFVAVALMQGAVYALAILLVWRAPGTRVGIALILGTAVALRIVVVLAPPYLSTDIYRYIWDGRVIAAGINPYRHVPTDPELASLQDAEIFPHINRKHYAPTIYPPAAEAIFFAVTRVGESLTAMKAAMIGVEVVAMALLIGMLTASGHPVSRIVIYAWHPLPLWEFAGSGHIDAAIVAFVALALWSRRAAPRGLALAAALLIKFYPAVVLPALWRRWDWRLPAVFAGTIVLAYLPFLGAGWRVLGFLPRYFGEEGFVAGGGAGFYLWNVIKSAPLFDAAPDLAYLAGAGLLLVGLAGLVAWRPRRPDPDLAGAALLAGIFMLLLSPHYAWYFTWLIVFACLLPSPALVWLTTASFLLYLVPVWPLVVWNRHRFVIETVIYLPFLLLAAAELWWRRGRRDSQT